LLVHFNLKEKKVRRIKQSDGERIIKDIKGKTRVEFEYEIV
jgi:hypothetical protein